MKNTEGFVTRYEDCENDCKILCSGCDSYFCDIKERNGLPHSEELPASLSTLSGEYFCHSDCGER